MERDELYRVVDAILNQANPDELEVIREALKRREADSGEGGFGGLQMSPKKLAEGTAHSISEQISYSRDTLRNMIKNFAVDIIRKEAPELSDEQVRELLQAWIPDPGAGSRGRTGEGGRKGEEEAEYDGKIPKDVLVTMIEQFILYSEGNMSVRQQAELRRDIPDWQNLYWERFPRRIKDAVSLYLKGTIDKESFWLDVYKTLKL